MSECLVCKGSGYCGPQCADDVPHSMRPIGCWVCGSCNGTGDAKDWADDMKKAEYTGPEEITPCFCIGPQNGEKLCPCVLRGIAEAEQRNIMEESERWRSKP